MGLKTESIREIKKNEKKQRIQDAAIRIMARNGYHGTTVSQIAREADVADGTLYLYFENKDDLLIGILEEITDRFIEEGMAMMGEVRNPLERLKAVADLHLRKLGSDHDIACLFQVEIRHNIRLMRKFSETKLREYFSVVEGIIRDAQAQGLVRPELNPWITAKILFGALDEMATNWVLRKRDYKLNEMAGPTIDILLNGMVSK